MSEADKVDGEVISGSGAAPVAIGEQGSLILPGGRKLDTASVEFESALTPYIPPDVAEQVIKNSKAPAYSPLQIVLIIAVIGTFFTLLWWFFPQPEPISKTQGHLDIVPPKAHSVQREYDHVYKKARRSHSAGEFAAGIELLEDAIINIRSANKIAENTELIYLFLDSAYQHDNTEHKHHAYELALAMCRQFPNELTWLMYAIELQMQLELQGIGYRPSEHGNIWRFMRSRSRLSRYFDKTGVFSASADTVRGLNTKLNLAVRLAEKSGDDGMRKALLAKKAQVLTTLWIFTAYKDNYPDDNAFEPGVSEREEAYVIARQLGDREDMLRLRKFILEALKESKWANYYFDGEVRWGDAHLNSELKAVNAAFARVKL